MLAIAIFGSLPVLLFTYLLCKNIQRTDINCIIGAVQKAAWQ